MSPENPSMTSRSRLYRNFSEGIVKTILVACASFSILTTFSIILVLATQTWSFFNIESPVLTSYIDPSGGSDDSGEVVVTLDQIESDWFATLSNADRPSLDFNEHGVHVGDELRVFQQSGNDAPPIGSLEVAAVEPKVLRLAGDMQGDLEGEFRIEIWRDEVSAIEFATGTEWNPLLGAQKHFGIWPLICGTMLVTGVAMLIAIPFGLMTAIFLSEYAPSPMRSVLKPLLEVLAGVPTVVYGFFALTVITPFLRSIHEGFEIYNVFSAGLAVGIMCLPIVCSISEDAIRAVPRSLREGAYGLGATKFDVSTKVTVPAALSGIVAASLLAIARAVGETMIVALAAGNLARMTIDVRDQAQTMTAYMVQIFLGDASQFGPEYYSSYAVAATLFVMTLSLTVLGHYIRRRFREEYE